MTAGPPSATDLPPTARHDSAGRGLIRRHAIGWWLGAAVLIGLRLHAFPAPFETDECNYAYFGRQMLTGDRLYTDLWDHQPPGIFAGAAALVWSCGDAPWVFRTAATLAALGTLLLLAAAARLRLGRSAVVFVVAVWALSSSDPGVAGEGWNREVFMNVGGVAALLLAARGGHRALLAAGVCLGLASLLKTVAAAQWLALAPVVMIWPRPAAPRVRVQRILLFAAGPAVLWGGTLLYFRVTDRLPELIDAAFIYNLDYGRVDVPLIDKMQAFFTGRWPVFRSALPLWLAGAAGLVALPWTRAPRWALLVAAYVFGSFIAVCLPGRFWPHYYQLMMPGLTLAAAALLDRLIPRGPPPPDGRPLAAAAHAYAALVLITLIVAQYVFYLRVPAEYVAYPRYGDRMSWARDQGRRVATATTAEDSIYVASRVDTGVYYYGNRRCATRYTLATPLLGDGPAARQRRANLLADLRADPPRLILVVAGTPFIDTLDQFIREQGYALCAQPGRNLQVLCAVDRPIEQNPWVDP